MVALGSMAELTLGVAARLLFCNNLPTAAEQERRAAADEKTGAPANR